jgi:hypothetical protein
MVRRLLLWVALAVLVAALARTLPDAVRYLKIKRM